MALITSCGINSNKESANEAPVNISQKVDEAVKQLEEEISSFKKIASLDHHRMAAAEGVYTPPSTAILFSDSKIDVALVQGNQLAGLDLPFKVLCYSEPDTAQARVAYTSAEFIQKRHQLDAASLVDYKSNMTKVIASIPQEMVSVTDLSGVEEGFGIINIKSDFDHATTIESLRNIVMAQGDTKWFADIDYQKEASALGLSLRPTVLLLFGGPAPGGKAMVTSPKIGLDAFCQKLLVYEKDNGEVWIAYNDIIAFSELYYGSSTKPQQMINQRLKMTFTKAVSIQ